MFKVQSAAPKDPKATTSKQDVDKQSGASAETVDLDLEAELPMDIGSSDSESNEVELGQVAQSGNVERLPQPQPQLQPQPQPQLQLQPQPQSQPQPQPQPQTQPQTQPLQKENLRSRPNQPLCQLKKDQHGRRFRGELYETFPWLEWDGEAKNGNGAAFCHTCRQAKLRNVPSSGKCEESFSKTGFTNWKNASPKFLKHEKSESHRLLSYKMSKLWQGENVAQRLDTRAQEESKQNTQYLLTIITSLKYLAKQGLAIRGHTDQNSNFMTLLQLRSEEIKGLDRWLTRKTSWTSHQIQEEIINLMSSTVMRQLAAEMGGKPFAILADETADVSRIEQLCICVRTATENLVLEEYVLGLYSLDKCDAESIFKTMKDALIRYNLPLSLCRAACFDGAASFQGKHSGVAVRLQEEEPRVVTTHCYMHSINLAVQDMVKHVPKLRNFLTTVTDLINFLRDSPKRVAIVKTVAEALGCPQAHIRPLCPTRFTVKQKALNNIKEQLQVVKEALVTIEDTVTDRDSQSRASGFLRVASSFDFTICLFMSVTVFEVSDRLSEAQSPHVSAGEGVKLTQVALGQLQNIRKDECFDEVWQHSLDYAQKHDQEEPTQPRQSRAPRRLQDSDPHAFETPKDMFKSVWFDALDNVISGMQDRVSSKAISVLSAVEDLLLSAWSDREVPTKSLECVVKHFGDGLNESRLEAQLRVLENLRDITGSSTVAGHRVTVKHIIDSISETDMKSIIPEVVKLCRLYIVHPATTATAERSFSTLRRLKSYLRGTMSQSRLNSLLILTMYRERVELIDMVDLVNEFISRGDTKRRNAFAPLRKV
ncbi:zinc finger MYM-type protein 1-like [Diadema antillarum]|uniref:zinc finger MYM-type protein 1-like n=1 Tax=Diadema antillarum TaxID=105358 RepID=UPI003A88381E